MGTLRSTTRRIAGPPYAYEGERERLTDEYRDLRRELERLPPRSRLRAGLEYRIVKITTRLLAIGEPLAPVPGRDRSDLQ